MRLQEARGEDAGEAGWSQMAQGLTRRGQGWWCVQRGLERDRGGRQGREAATAAHMGDGDGLSHGGRGGGEKWMPSREVLVTLTGPLMDRMWSEVRE